MTVRHLSFDQTQIQFDPGEIKNLLGDEFAEVDSYTEVIIDKVISRCRECMSPQGSFLRTKALISEGPAEVSIDGARFETGKTIKKMLAGSEEYVFLLATAGPGPEMLARELIEEGEFLEGYIADLVASTLVEAVANLVQKHIQQWATQHELKITNRYSPGYCKWEVGEQQKLFKLFPENCCGITLSESSLMTPIKSLSAILGIGPSVAYQEYTCEICSMKECLYRKTSIRSLLP